MIRRSILSVISTILWTVLFHVQLVAAEAKIEGLVLDKQINEILVLDVNSYETVHIPIVASVKIERNNHDGITFDDLRIGWFVEITQEIDEGGRQTTKGVKVQGGRFNEVALDGFQEGFVTEGLVVVDGQNVLTGSAQVKGSSNALTPGLITKVKGVRLDDGSVEAREIEVAPNETGGLERDVLRANVRDLRVLNKKVNLLENPGLQAYIKEVGTRLIPAAMRNAIDFRFHVIEDPTLNAFAVRSFSTVAEDRMLGSIYVHTGLLKILANESQLAAVLGHEIAHVTHEHSTRGLTRSIWTDILTGIAQGVVRQATSEVWGVLAETGVGMASSAIVNGYQRDFEDQADRVGLRYVYDAGYHPMEAPKVWDIFSKEVGDQDAVTNFFYGRHSTHLARKRNLFLEISQNYLDQVNCKYECELSINEDEYKINVLNRLEVPVEIASASLSGVLFLPYRTDSHRSRSDADVFLRAVDGVLQHLKSREIHPLDDDFFKSHFHEDRRFDRLIGFTQTEGLEPPIASLLEIAASLDADSLFFLRVDRTWNKWINLDALCYDLSGELLWQSEVSEGGMSSKGHVEKSVLKLTEELDKRLGEGCLASIDDPIEHFETEAEVTLTGSSPTYPPPTAPPYDRRLYEHWIDADGDCQNTRQEVLIAESLEPVTLDSSGCHVESGRWFDSFTGQEFSDPADLDIDHIVPLAEAHLSGADAWTADRRTQYANDLTNPDTLIAVATSANRSKGDRDPSEWLPTNESFQCDYVARWIMTKARWALGSDEPERDAIATVLSQCTPADDREAGVNAPGASPHGLQDSSDGAVRRGPFHTGRSGNTDR